MRLNYRRAIGPIELNIMDTRQWITHEVGVRWLERIGLEIMLWGIHVQFIVIEWREERDALV